MIITAIIALLINLVSFSIKLQNGRRIDAAIDVGVFAFFLWAVGTTATGFIITTVASAFFSIYLFFTLKLDKRVSHA